MLAFGLVLQSMLRRTKTGQIPSLLTSVMTRNEGAPKQGFTSQWLSAQIPSLCTSVL